MLPCFSWTKLASAVIAIWLTLTASLYVVLLSEGPSTTVLDTTEEVPSYRLRPLHQQPRRRTAHEKFLAWARAHKPTEKTTSLTNNVWYGDGRQAEATPALRRADMPPLDDMEEATQKRLKMTAHEKLEAYAHKMLPKITTGTSILSQRHRFEAQYPPSVTDRIRSFVSSLRTSDIDDGIHESFNSGRLPFDPFDCPDAPPADYPLHYSLVEMLHNWPVDELKWPSADRSDLTSTHPYLYQSLCIFDWDRPEHRERARRYQVEYDVPFVLRNHPEFMKATERWTRPQKDGTDYLQTLVGDEPQRAEHSFLSNHLPFWRTRGLKKLPANWEDPTENVMMPYAEWSQRADAMDAAIEEGQDHSQMDHYYFRLSSQGEERNPYMYTELPVFDPKLYKEGENLFMLHPDQARGINCRFGMAGNVAESHFDYSSNWIALLGGHRRYILSHPRECGKLALYPPGHPSARHSSVNWSRVLPGEGSSTEVEKVLGSAAATQVVLQASDALYLPTNWMHFIVSLDRNYQCNARSGVQTHYNSYMTDCGFEL